MHFPKAIRRLTIAASLAAALSGIQPLRADTLVGTLPGSLSVDNKGAANYSIPLAIPPGRGGMQPSLALSYNSGSGNGPLGLAWSLSYGSAKITRGRSILARDGYVHGMSHTTEDRLYLDGRLLIKVSGASSYWEVGNIYRTEVDSFVTITALGANGSTSAPAGTQIEAFKLTDKNGSVFYFGKIDAASADAIHQLYGTVYYGWAVKRVVDAVGNTMEYTYTAYQNSLFNYITNAVGRPTGEHLLSGINYTSNPTAGVSAEFGVRFAYSPDNGSSERADVYQGYLGGRANEARRRLAKIEIGTFNGTAIDPFIRYDLQYETSPVSGLSRLSSVTYNSKAAADSTWDALPATSIDYKESGSDGRLGDPLQTTTSTSTAQALTATHNSMRVATGDFNGDGRTDKFFDGKVHLGTGTGFDDGNVFGSLPEYDSWPVVRAGDVNGDGLADLYFFSPNTVYIARSTGSGFVNAAAYTACTLGAASLDTDLFGLYPEAGAARISLGDFNGDGLTDVLIHRSHNASGGTAGLYVALSDGAVLSTPSRWGSVSLLDHFSTEWEGMPGVPFTWERVHNVTQMEPIVADFNGDGIDDYVYTERFIQEHNSAVTYETTLRGAIARPQYTGLSRLTTQSIQWQDKTVSNVDPKITDAPILKALSGDCNGDSYRDLLVLCERPVSPGVTQLKWCLFPGTGSGFGEAMEDYMPVDDPVYGLPNHNIDYVLASDSYRYFWFGQHIQSGGMYLLDFNRDGRADYVFGRGESDGWLVKYATKDGFGATQQLWTHGQGDFEGVGYTPYIDVWGEGGVSMEPIDIDGDGATDWLLTLWSSTGSGSIPLLAKGRVADADLLDDVTNGLGAVTQVAYKSTADSSIYTPGAPVAYPIQEVRHPQLVVSDIWHDSGAGTTSSPTDRAQFSYQYSGNRLDLSGRGSLGFHSFVTLDRQTGLFKYQFLAQSFPMTGLTHRDETYRWWNTGGQDKFRFISSHDNTVVFDKVVKSETDSTAWGTLWPYISKAVEYRWEDSTTEHFSFAQAAANSQSESLFTQTKPTGEHIKITAESRFDKQTATQLTLPSGSGYSPSDFTGSANTVSGAANSTAFTNLLASFNATDFGKITYGNLERLSTDFGGGFTETVVTTYKDPVGALTGLVDTVTTTVVSPGYGTETAPTKSYTYFGNTPLVATETIDASDNALDLKNTYTRDSRGRVTNTQIENTTATGLQAIGNYSVSSVPTPSTDFDDRWDLPKKTRNAAPYYHTTTTAYHSFLGLPESVSDVNGAQITTVYDAIGRVIQQNDILKGLATNQAFGWTTSAATDWKKTQSVTVPSGIVGLPGLALSSAYAVRTTTTVAPPVTAYYDRLGRVIRTIKEGFNDQLTVADTIYNKLGQVVATSLPYLQEPSPQILWTKFTYDPLGRVATVTAPNLTVTTNTYIGRATKVSVDAPNLGGVDPAAQVNTTLVDAKGRTVKVWNADNVPSFSDNVGTTATAASITFALDGFGRMRTTTLKGQTQTITATYDALGRQLTLNDPDKGNWTYVNNALGQVVSQTDANTNTTESTFDRLGRPLSRSTTGNGSTETATFHYYDVAATVSANPSLNLVAQGAQGWIGAPEREEADTTGAPGFDAPKTINLHYYDAKGRPSLELAQTDGKWFYTATNYDTYSRPQSVRHYWKPAGAELPSQQPYVWQDFGYVYNYDAESYLLSITDSLGRLWWDSPAYDHLDRVTSVRKGNGLTTSRDYRPTDGVLTGITTGSVQSLGFTFDGLGNLRQRTDANATGGTENLTYDNLNRLETSKQGTTTYAANGNITTKPDVNGTVSAAYAYAHATKPHAVTTAFGYTIDYDGNGNVVSRLKTGDNTYVKWAGFDKPRWLTRTTTTGTTGSEFHYNAARSRVLQLEFDSTSGSGASQVPLHYNRKRTYALGSTLELNYDNLATDSAQNWSLKKVRIYVPGPDGLIGAREFDVTSGSAGTEKAIVYHYDHLGSITATTDYGSASFTNDALGKPGKFSEDAWGQRRNPATWSGAPDPAVTDNGGDNSVTPRGFTGHEMLDDLGLVHMNGRIYDPLLGRFLSADTYVQFAYELQSYNRYTYVRNNPLTAIDPSGFLEVVEDKYHGVVQLNNGYIVSQQYGARIEALVYNLNVAVEKGDKPAESLYRNQVVAELERLKGPLAINPSLALYLAENPEVGAKMLDMVVASTALAIEAYSNKGIVPQGAASEGARSAHDTNTNSIKNRQIRGVDESIAKPTGRRTVINKNDKHPENIRGIARENESADILAGYGFKVEQNPQVAGPKNPDYSINGKTYDNYAPSGSSARSIWYNVKEKVEAGQASRIVLNLSDSKASLADIAKQFTEHRIKDLKDLLIIKDDKVYRLK